MSNLRIKNKKLKRELELLNGMTVQPRLVYDRRGVVSLSSKHVYDDSSYGTIPQNIIGKVAVRDFADNIIPYIRFNSYRDHYTGKIVVEARLDVVSKED